jgi:hypothetical protein
MVGRQRFCTIQQRRVDGDRGRVRFLRLNVILEFLNFAIHTVWFSGVSQNNSPIQQTIRFVLDEVGVRFGEILEIGLTRLAHGFACANCCLSLGNFQKSGTGNRRHRYPGPILR